MEGSYEDPLTGELLKKGKFPLDAEIWDEWKNKGAFVVQSGDLGFSVIVFTICAICTVVMILVRRKFGNQELGGNKKMAWASFGVLVVLWFLYIIMSCLSTYGMIELDM